MPGWTGLKELMREEVAQRREEGCVVDGFTERVEAAATDSELMCIYHDLQQLRVSADFAYVEPSHLGGIRAARPGASRRWSVEVGDALLDRLHGAWLGRIAGCALGKPVEGWGKDDIEQYLKTMGEYPLTNYVPPAPVPLPEGIKRRPRAGCSRGEFPYALTDDDTNYTIIGLKIMEEKGIGFTTSDVGSVWLGNLPYYAVCTAERQAYVNLVNEFPIDRVPTYLNPYREWIGAQIRADFWGYAAPGWPEKAAEFAYRDAALTHIKNGIYGEMFCAAAISAALVTDDLDEIIATAANEVPAHCRLTDVVADCLRWKNECSTWEEAFGKMMETYYGKYSWVHTNNNLAIVLIGLLFGWPDYEKVVTYSVAQGLDTDCNGATAGSIIGAALGAKALPDKWIRPLGGKLESTVIGFPLTDTEELAVRTMKQVERVLAL